LRRDGGVLSMVRFATIQEGKKKIDKNKVSTYTIAKSGREGLANNPWMASKGEWPVSPAV
jgi:hypothetical protein